MTRDERLAKESERLAVMMELESALWQQKDIVLAGMDEVGRGPLAGPVVAACVVLPQEPVVLFVNDSKKLSAKKREEIYENILAQATGYALGWVEPEIIDSINILQATKLAFCHAFQNMPVTATDVLIDAVEGLDIPAAQHVYIHGDERSYLIAAASIVAKVQRDRYMADQDELYPMYGFARNKGYGTAEHIAALRHYGPCPLHRRSFLKNFLESGA